ncbi:laccase IV [Purpureocillium lilacinum]|uniref:Laccase IV n=1 Tax=Purpureocillium lilacinum TaxID=33203 RepID=A0A179H733_PURLI|nr:laccase IV [Purpureocillium lilacinum]
MEPVVFSQNAPAKRCRPGLSSWLCLWLMIPIICFGLYFAIVQTYSRSEVSSPPSAWLPDGGDGSGAEITEPQSHAEPVDNLHDDDPSILHPQRHIFRQPRTIHLNWNVTKGTRRPDGVLKDIYLINGQFPGPTIEARSGDRIEVIITNSIANDTHDGLAVHWHGMLMKEANEMDGVVGVTQCSIRPTDSFTYKFQIPQEQHGTFWYHAHSAVKRADGLYGGLIVHKPADQDQINGDLSLYEYDKDRTTKITDATIAIILDPELMPVWNPALTSKQLFPLIWTDPSDAAFRRKQKTAVVEIYDLDNTEAPRIPDSSMLRTDPVEVALLYTSLAINSFKNDEPWGELNHTSWVWKDPTAKPLLAMDNATWANGTVQANPMRDFRVPWFETGDERWLELVVNNVDDKGHPFHLHGYEFYVVASRQPATRGKTHNPFDDAHEANKQRNLDTPLKRDTVYIKPQGHVVLRFPLHNPGLWLMHCHVLWHQAVGMGMVLQVGNVTLETARKAKQSCQ